MVSVVLTTGKPSVHVTEYMKLGCPPKILISDLRKVNHKLRCFTAARANKLEGTFRGFLSATVQDIYTIVRRTERNDYPICNSKVKLDFILLN